MSAPQQLQQRKRPLPYESSYPPIRPRPSVTSSPYDQTSPAEHPPKKKRGRPTKEEARLKTEAQGSSSEQGSRAPPIESGEQPAVGMLQAIPAPGPPPPDSRKSQPSLEVSTRSSLPAVSGMSISSMLTPTAPTTNSASQSSSSSGKRRCGKSTRSEPESQTPGTIARADSSLEYESPYARMAVPSMQASPARAAVLRHREEQGGDQRYSPTDLRDRNTQGTTATPHRPPDPNTK